jgi:hypothetical protein
VSRVVRVNTKASSDVTDRRTGRRQMAHLDNLRGG